ncbi:hypothetical protein CG747_12560 [Streptomyces sp. CB02959]|uniref:hypothetical protein n=1 Tax=Streptomyces sp. CB02959 TaxID=2020330 RepID=UPI000C274B4F|nr:hypothetical protein [Streptomyces sp. CB02959]PJN40497.1 hypothetical protein CG747_12560 [Streptomyces sp. CB02959]
MTTNDPPESPAEQGKALAKHNRRATARQGLQPTPATQRFTEAMLAIFNEFEHNRRAEIIAAGGDPADDRDPLEYVRVIAEQYERHQDPQERQAFINSVADDLDLDDVRALRVAGEAAVAATPELIMRNVGRGMKPPQIAEEIGLTPSRVYDLIRKERQRAAHEKNTITAAEPSADEDRASTHDDAAGRRRWAREYRRQQNGDTP